MIHPITIISTLPTAGVGALLALLFCNKELSLMIDLAIVVQRHDLRSLPTAFPPHHDDHGIGSLRWSALAFGQGIGSEVRQSLGIVIVGGLIFSQVLRSTQYR